MECKQCSHRGAQFSHFCVFFPLSPQVFELWIIFQSIPYYRMLLVLTYGELHTPLTTLSIVSAQTSCHVGVGESNRNQLARFTTANWWNFAYQGGNLWRKNCMLEKKLQFWNQHANSSFNQYKNLFFPKLFTRVIEVAERQKAVWNHF